MAAFRRRKIKSVKTIGAQLKEARESQEILLATAEARTKIRAKYLTALEEGNFRRLPGPVYTVGYLARYAEFLGLDGEQILNQLRQTPGLVGDQLPPKFFPARSIPSPKVIITPRRLLIGAGVLLVVGLISYIGYAVAKFSSPPPLEISTPAQDSVAHDPQIVLTGDTTVSAELFINDQPVGVDERGHFEEVIGLSTGLNVIEVKSSNRAGKETVKKWRVQYQPSAEGPKS